MPKQNTNTLEALRALQTAPPVAAPPPRPERAVLAGLAIVGLVAAALITFSFVREARLSTLERKATTEVDALLASSASFGAALRTFGMTREPENEWFSRTSALVAELHDRAQAADATLVGIAMMPRARVAESLQAAGEAVDRARANAEADKDLMAQDVLESNGRPAAEALDGALLSLRTATADEIAGMRSRWRTVAAAGPRGVGAGLGPRARVVRALAGCTPGARRTRRPAARGLNPTRHRPRHRQPPHLNQNSRCQPRRSR